VAREVVGAGGGAGKGGERQCDGVAHGILAWFGAHGCAGCVW
jgi:hypothetical protein